MLSLSFSQRGDVNKKYSSVSNTLINNIYISDPTLFHVLKYQTLLQSLWSLLCYCKYQIYYKVHRVYYDNSTIFVYQIPVTATTQVIGALYPPLLSDIAYLSVRCSLHLEESL